jgi:predicted unusual protein kinase regulating ubiquinone biosynthesis (AarF/ABC1/UbiB family)
MIKISELSSLYETDNEQWLEQTLKLLKEKELESLDLEHLIEELESVGRRDRLTVESFLEQIIRHLLLLQYWQAAYEYNANHWQAEIISFRTQLNEYLTQNLRNHLEENQSKVYQKALKYVSKKTGMMVSFPEDCPYTLEQLLDQDWLP